MAIVIGIVIGYRFFGVRATTGSPAQTIAVHALAVVIWVLAVAANRLYTARCLERIGEETRRLVVAGAVAVGAVLGLAFLVDAPLPDRRWALGTFAVVTITLIVSRAEARAHFARLRRSGTLARPIAVIGTDDEAVALARRIEEHEGLGYEVVGLIGREAGQVPGDYPVIGAYDCAADAMTESGCIGAVVSLSSVDADRVNTLTRELTERGFHVALSTTLRDIDVSRMRPQRLDGEVLIYVEPSIRTGWHRRAKRAFDLVVAGSALVVTMPVLIIAALLIKLDSRGPVLFHQERVGRRGALFQMLKLRTMSVDAAQHQDELAALNEASGPMFKIKHDPRVTRIGRLLRRTSIDELPQFWNVLRGEMSVVGPRPALPNEMNEWDEKLFRRLAVPPGITGTWQVSGRSETSFEQYRRLDLYYVDNWSLAHDLEIVVRTFWVVLTGRGAS